MTKNLAINARKTSGQCKIKVSRGKSYIRKFLPSDRQRIGREKANNVRQCLAKLIEKSRQCEEEPHRGR